MFKIGKYILPYKIDDKTLLYNTINGAIVEIENDQITNNEIINLNDNEEKELLKMGFNKEFTLEELENLYQSPQHIMNLIIELTKNCNLRCAYCYQREWETDKKTVISDEIIEKICNLCKIISNKDINIITLSFIGGEPLLQIDKMITIYNKIKKVSDEKNIKLYVYIDTNGTIFSDKLKEIKNLFINITVSCPEDHNKLRKYITYKDCYTQVIENILKIEKEIKNAKLSLRYNVHNKNINDLEKHIKSLISKGISSREMDLAYTVSHNEFINTLSKSDYYKWIYDDAYKILKKYKFSIRYFPVYSFYPCSAYSKNSFKVHCDGKISLCDSWDIKKSKFSIDDVIKNPDMFFDFYKNIKYFTPIKNKKCQNCKFLLLCGGLRFCDKNPCEKFNYLNLLLSSFKNCN